jgi:hypothetical protein
MPECHCACMTLSPFLNLYVFMTTQTPRINAGNAIPSFSLFSTCGEKQMVRNSHEKSGLVTAQVLYICTKNSRLFDHNNLLGYVSEGTVQTQIPIYPEHMFPVF